MGGARGATHPCAMQRKPSHQVRSSSERHSAEGEDSGLRAPSASLFLPSTLPVGDLGWLAWGMSPSLSVTECTLLAQFSMALCFPDRDPGSDLGSVSFGGLYLLTRATPSPAVFAVSYVQG